MSAKEKKKISKIALILAIIMLFIICIYIKFISSKETYAVEKEENTNQDLEISGASLIDIEEITEDYFCKNLYNNLPDVDLSLIHI